MMSSTIFTIPVPQVQPVIYRLEHVLCMGTCPLTLAGIYSLLAPPLFQVQHYVVAPRASEMPMLAVQCQTDLVVMELCGQGESIMKGLRALKLLRSYRPYIPIVVFTALKHARLFKQLVELGVNCIYFKQDPLQILASCIINALEGRKFHSPSVLTLLEKEPFTPSMLTDREINIIEQLFNGSSVTAIALKMQRDVRTVSSHKRSAMRKMGFRSDFELHKYGSCMFRSWQYV